MPRKPDITRLDIHVLPVRDIGGEPMWLVGSDEEYSLKIDKLDLPPYAYEHFEETDFWRIYDEQFDDAIDALVDALDADGITVTLCPDCQLWIDGSDKICEAWGDVMVDIVDAGFELREKEDEEFKTEQTMPLKQWFDRIVTVLGSDEVKAFGKFIVESKKSDVRAYLRQRYGVELSDELVDQIIASLFGSPNAAGGATGPGMSYAEACEVLGVSRGASRDEILKAFRTKVQETHPDKGGSNEAFVRVVKAREVLLGEV